MARAWANVDLDAVVHNVTVLREHVAPARFCAVVKADGYGHGSVAVSRAALAAGADWLAVPVRVHLKVDTGMRRVGVEPDEALSLAKSIAESPRLELEGVFTHFPVADEASNDFTAVQVTRLDQVVE